MVDQNNDNQPSLSVCSKCGKHARILAFESPFNPEFYSKNFGQYLLQRSFECGVITDLEEFMLELCLSKLSLPEDDEGAEKEIIDAVNFWNTAGEDFFSWDDMRRFECVLDFKEACKRPEQKIVIVPFFWNEVLVTEEDGNMIWFNPPSNPSLN